VRRIGIVAIGTILAGAALSAAGCGSSSAPTSTTPEASKTADQILADTRAAAKSATTVHTVIAGLSGRFSGATLDMARGTGAQGSVTVGTTPVKLVASGGTFYVKAPAAFWESFTSSAQVAAGLGGKWVKVPTAGTSSSALAEAQVVSDMDGLFATVLHPGSALTKDGTSVLHGIRVVKLADASGGALYVSLEGTPYPVEVHQDPKAGGGTATFSGWNAPVTISVPAGALDFSAAG
jgi:hypothetical protein